VTESYFAAEGTVQDGQFTEFHAHWNAVVAG
jgi:hypothetical protein